MAKKQEDNSAQAAQAGGHGRFARYCLTLGWLGAVILAWLSLLSYSPTDWPSPSVYPSPPVQNAAGGVGAALAYTLRYWLGGGVYMGLLFATVAAMIMIFGGSVRDLPWRIIGVLLLVAATSSAVYLLDPGPAAGGNVMSGSAGVIGIAAGRFLLSRFSETGGWCILILTLCAGLMLTADKLVLQLPRLGMKAWSRRGELPSLVGVLRPRLTANKGVREVTARPRAVAVVPASSARTTAHPAVHPTTIPKLQPLAEAPQKPPPAKADRNGDGSRQYELPPADLLAEPSGGYSESQELLAEQKRQVLQQTLTDFNVSAEVIGHMTGPVITMFELTLAPGVKVSQVSNLGKDIARALAVPGVRVVSPIPGKDTIGIEVPNLDKEIVRIKELMNAVPQAESQMRLPLYLGKDAGGGAIVADLGGMPHMLIAGTTGSGKSVCINAIIMSLLMTRTPEEVRFILVDPKMVEMAAFENIPHLLCPIINDVRTAEDLLEWAATKMDERYELLKEANVKNIAGYNALSAEQLYERFQCESEEDRARIPLRIPSYVIIVDELADLIMTSSKEVENHIIRIAQKARAVGIHLILATQRPSVNVVTGLIKSNMPCRISFRVASRQESRIVLDQNGAEVLLGRGDMLFLQPGTSTLNRAQGTYVEEGEISQVVRELRKSGKPQYNTELVRLSTRPTGEMSGQRDELFDKAVEVVLASQRGSVSLLQRRLQIGYSRSSRIIDQMADAGLLGDYKGSQARECLMTLEQWQGLQKSIADDQSGVSAANGEPMSV
ncbi:MAG: DNA translocase FtsK 4TM domain-containing protein [Planctomycetota bacterium]|nr:DNA translocase FtsK 4TM domain-containing protein [Planctomycetota bacterium]